MNKPVVCLIAMIGFPLCAAICWADSIVLPLDAAATHAWNSDVETPCGMSVCDRLARGARCDAPTQDAAPGKWKAQTAAVKATTSENLSRFPFGPDLADSGNPVPAHIEGAYVYMGVADPAGSVLNLAEPARRAMALRVRTATSVWRAPQDASPDSGTAVRTTVDIPEPLHDALLHSAEYSGASVRALILRAIQQAYAEHPKNAELTPPAYPGEPSTR